MGFSEILKDLRKSRNLTRQQLADNTGLSVHTIISYEKGRRKPNFKSMAALEKYLQVSGEYLRGEVSRETFLKDHAAIQNKMENITELFQAFKNEFDCSSQENKLSAITVLGYIIEILTENLLHSDTFSDLSADEVNAVFSSIFKLNRKGRSELAKRAIELTQLVQYQK